MIIYILLIFITFIYSSWKIINVILFWLLILWVAYIILSKIISSSFKEWIFQKHLKDIDKNFDFSSSKWNFPLLASEFYTQSWLLNSYEWIDTEEDSIKIINDAYNFYWEELETYKRTTDKDWNRRKTTVDHCYIMYIKILNHRFPFKNKIKLVPDIADNIYKKIFYIIVISILVWSMFFYLNSTILKIDNHMILYAIYFVLFILTIVIFNYSINKNRVKLENSEFEKIFDVYWNQIESRRLLTPKLMEILVKTVKDSNRKW